MSKEVVIAQMQGILDRKKDVQQTHQNKFGFDTSYTMASIEDDLTLLRRGQIAPNHRWGMRTPRDGKKE